MKLASYQNGQPDGCPMLVSRDLSSTVDISSIVPSLLYALLHWESVLPQLQQLSDELNRGLLAYADAFDAARCMAPLPRTFQWCDASAFLNHGRLMERAFNTPPIPDFDTVPVMYQGASDDFIGAQSDVALPDEALGIDFEGEFGVITGPVPMGATAQQALAAVRLLVQLNDWSLRALGPREMKSGFGFLQAKPSTSFAPVAVTPDELGNAWKDGRVHLDLAITWNGTAFGHPNGSEMNFSFGELIAHAARTRRLSSGTIIGSGTVSNEARDVGSACIAERRVIEILDHGEAHTEFMRFGDRVRMQACASDGTLPFGVIDQQVVRSDGH
ncbi:fumarylacetoacetate (FAA) hydrolase [Duganella sp. CF402]|uniref:fumarylacetoacetate hydrolase family protein n=1 Tax=unclassified Duganella TaxID=2636909 RepID=UPI0008BE3176|nr:MULTISPECIES: fumarylacetoacetate hydrolase family protein [unclassified Duganella]RZT08206.1 fumarylacetoacetate (FAA) hydrolase [Duganella sp. BK701]SEM02208.1 fumarylacetoacetate (FAA) hydrolase [Duganella sp. CF402]